MTEVAVKSTVPFINLADKSVDVKKRNTGRFANWCLDVGQKQAYSVTGPGQVRQLDRTSKQKPNGWLVALKIVLLVTVVFALIAAIARNVFLNANKFKEYKPTPPPSRETSPHSSQNSSASSSGTATPVDDGGLVPAEEVTVRAAAEILRNAEQGGAQPPPVTLPLTVAVMSDAASSSSASGDTVTEAAVPVVEAADVG